MSTLDTVLQDLVIANRILFDQNVVATVTGLSGFGAGMAGTAVTLAVGLLVDRFSYTPAFLFVTALPLLATAAVLLLIHPRKATD